MKPNPDQMNLDYWRQLNPELTIGAAYGEDLAAILDEHALKGASDHLNREGYFTLPPVLNLELINRLRHGMERLKQAGHPPVYIYLYDESWFVFAALSKLISRFLGDDFALLPNFWAWHLDTEKGSVGWPPHQDCQAQTCFSIDEDNIILMSLSLWVPLSEATLDNGCMMVLPKTIEKSYGPPISSIEDINLHDAVALPAQSGAVMGWTQEAYHWSATATGKSEIPRMSLSLEFQNKSFEPLGTPLLDAAAPPNFEGRLELILSQFEKYQHINS